MGDDITIGVTEIVNNIEVTAQPNDQVVDINVTDNADEVTLNITPTVIEINVNKGSSFARWGSIIGNLTDQVDLTNALFNKADLVDGKVPSYQLPSFVDDVIEVANFAALPTVGETGKIYITLDNNKIYRWSGSIYIEIASNQAIWGAITGSLANQTDLVNALNLRVPYTGATSDVNLGDFDMFASKYWLYDAPNNNYGSIHFTDGNFHIEDGDGHNLFVIEDGYIQLHKNETIQSNLYTSGLTAIRDHYLPDASGTLALTSQLHPEVRVNTVFANGLSVATNQVLELRLASSNLNGALSSTDWNTFNNKLSDLNGAVLTTTDQSVAGVKTFTGLARFTNSRFSDFFAIEIDVNSVDALVVKDSGTIRLQIGKNGQILGQKYIVSGGFSSQFLKANGDLDSTVYTPASRTLTINGVTQDLSANRSFTVATHNEVSIGGGFNGLSIDSNQILSLALANGSANGALSSTDWTTFNNKQNALTNPITGTGAAGQVAFWNGVNTQTGDSGLVWDNTNKRLGVGGTPSAFRLDVNGTARVQGALTATADSTINGVNIGLGGGAIASNTRVGLNTLNANTTGASNTAIGWRASQSNTTGASNTSLGTQSLTNNTSGNQNTAIGTNALLTNTTGASNTAIGNLSLFSNISGGSNVAVGNMAGRFIADGTTALTIANSSIFIGETTRALADNQTNQIVIGHNAIGAGSNTVTLGNTSITTTRLRGAVQGGSFVRDGGTAAQYLMADGTVSTLTNPITGTGTTNFLPKFTGSSSLGNSLIFDNGTNVGIGTTSPQSKLSVSTTGNSIGVSIGDPGNTSGKNLDLGYFITADYGYIQAIHNGLAFKNIAINPNGGNVGIGATSPTSKLQVVGLPEYATNALALAGGLTVGAFYHTAGILKVVI